LAHGALFGTTPGSYYAEGFLHPPPGGRASTLHYLIVYVTKNLAVANTGLISCEFVVRLLHNRT